MLEDFVYKAVREGALLQLIFSTGGDIEAAPVRVDDPWIELESEEHGSYLMNVRHVVGVRLGKKLEIAYSEQYLSAVLAHQAELRRAANSHRVEYREGPDGTL